MDEDFASTSVTISHDHAGNLIDDGTFRYVYDAWNRLAAVKYSLDSGAVPPVVRVVLALYGQVAALSRASVLA